MSLQAIFDPMLRAYFKNKNGSDGGMTPTGQVCYGMTLPDINTVWWDKERRPYAVITRDRRSDGIKLWMMTATVRFEIRDVTGNHGYSLVAIINADDYDALIVGLKKDGEWDYNREWDVNGMYDPALWDEGASDIFWHYDTDVIWMSYTPKFVYEYDGEQKEELTEEYGSTPVYK